jgi:hypothetical protein
MVKFKFWSSKLFSRPTRRTRRASQPCPEVLEVRSLLSAITVTTTDDVVDANDN